MKNYNYKYELYDPYEYPNFSGYVITQDQLLRVKENRVEEQWDLDPIDESINALIRSARSESDMPRNAQILLILQVKSTLTMFQIMEALLSNILMILMKKMMVGSI